ncbi:flagellar FliJ protein [Caldalkalibacillus uzonensis]|uniref:Flagellar FliJ protein n=1 Tax=Caldalkalibacillus uzonensis TaxID=353224 RepID=A0ABU0CLH7_9BACI|nr:flagellar export protein FliJ [Caldalkalibacillus uzonensis]MDQ0337266.1 flagellar FliJ protein [Caldalkalibacillus uzonensis]
MAQYNDLWQRLLDVNTKQKEQAQLQLAEAMDRQNQAEERLHKTQQAIEQLNQHMVNQQQQGISSTDLQQFSQYAHYLHSQLMTEQRALLSAKHYTSTIQHRVRQFMTEEKKWLKLKEKQLKAYVLEQRRKEQKETDEVARHKYWGVAALRSEQFDRA